MTERRAWIRHSTSGEAECSAGITRDLIFATTRIVNVSQGGMKLLASREFSLETILRIKVPGVPVHLARVVHVTAQPEGRWALGCAFLTELTEAELGVILHAPANPDPGPPDKTSAAKL